MEKTIYTLKLHETMNLQNNRMTVMRVHTGWLYGHWDSAGYYINAIFIPYSGPILEESECTSYYNDSSTTDAICICGKSKSKH